MPLNSLSSTGAEPTTPQRRHGRTEELLDAAERVVGRDGAGASMASIAAEAGVSKPIVYRVFGSKAGLQLALVRRHRRQIGDQVSEALTSQDRASGSDWQQRTKQALVVYLEEMSRREGIYAFVASMDADTSWEATRWVSSLQDELAEYLTGVLGPLVDLPTGSPDRPPTWAVAVVGMAAQAGRAWMRQGMTPSSHAVADELGRLIVGGLDSLVGWQPDGQA